METTIFVSKCSMNSINILFSNGINDNVTIKFYEFISADRCKMLVRHSEEICFKQNATYTLDGFLKRCRTELDILRSKLADLESKLYEEQCKQYAKINRMGWGHAMRCVKCSISTTREEMLKERISEVANRIKEIKSRML
jgi:hypothetical protein